VQRISSNAVTTEASPVAAPRTGPRLFWWKEVLLIAGFYALYSFTRNQFGSATVDVSGGEWPYQAFDHAHRLIRIEEAVGLFHEKSIQDAFLHHDWSELWFKFWNTFYGVAHFVVTIGLFVWMFVGAKHLFPRWRNIILATTGLALIGFSLFPVMPPRLLNEPAARFGGHEIQVERDIDPPLEFVDTLAEFGGPWSFDSGAISKLSNQFAAMPSLHCGWALWCTLLGWRLTRKRWARALLVLHPIATLFCIVVTANHYWIDGVGGVLTLGAGFLVGSAFDHWNNARIARKSMAQASDAGIIPV